MAYFKFQVIRLLIVALGGAVISWSIRAVVPTDRGWADKSGLGCVHGEDHGVDDLDEGVTSYQVGVDDQCRGNLAVSVQQDGAIHDLQANGGASNGSVRWCSGNRLLQRVHVQHANTYMI